MDLRKSLLILYTVRGWRWWELLLDPYRYVGLGGKRLCLFVNQVENVVGLFELLFSILTAISISIEYYVFFSSFSNKKKHKFGILKKYSHSSYFLQKYFIGFKKLFYQTIRLFKSIQHGFLLSLLVFCGTIRSSQTS